MISRCRCSIDPVFAKTILQGLNDVIFTRSLIFRKPSKFLGISYVKKKYVTRPVTHDDKQFYRECIKLLNEGWINDIAERWYPKTLRDIGVFDEI